HPDLKNRIVASLDFTDSKTKGDDYGHGTHVAGIIAGSGVGSRGADGKPSYVGMAPGAGIVSMRVLGSDGTGFVSDAIEAIDYVIDHREELNIRVINLSLG